MVVSRLFSCPILSVTTFATSSQISIASLREALKMEVFQGRALKNRAVDKQSSQKMKSQALVVTRTSLCNFFFQNKREIAI